MAKTVTFSAKITSGVRMWVKATHPIMIVLSMFIPDTWVSSYVQVVKRHGVKTRVVWVSEKVT